jgi:pyruvate dehydrogenase E2 component (dihydrolipoamide acetyltransferase)
MPVEIKIPRLGWSMEEGVFQGWLKKEGELVKNGEPLFILESEKAAQDIESIDGGILRIPNSSPKAGDVVKVGQVIGNLYAGDETAVAETSTQNGSAGPATNFQDGAARPSNEKPKTQPKTIVSKNDSEPVQTKTQSDGATAISPRARRRAAELGVDTSGLEGSGGTGRIIEADVLKASRSTPAAAPSVMRRAIAKSTSLSFSTTPHFYLRCEVDATALVQLREDLLPEIEAKAGVRLTLTDLIVRAQAKALRAFPQANAIWVDDNIINFSHCDVGLVVGLPQGLIIPVLRTSDKGDLASLVKQRSSLVELARSGRLDLESLQGGATSLSNLGNSPVDEFAAVISPPQSTMLAVGRAMLRPFVINNSLAARMTMKLCLSVDHRVMDGGPAAEFMGCIMRFLEHPAQLLV